MKTFFRLMACACLLLLNHCKTHNLHENDAAVFRETLLQTLRKATAVKIEEHSSPLDFPDRKWSDSGPETHYGDATLSPEARSSFLKRVEALNPVSYSGYAACLPEFHHTIRFYEGDRLISTMKICFECEIINWDACRLKCPDDFFKVLDLIVTEAGLHPKRDWKALAKGTSTSSQVPR